MSNTKVNKDNNMETIEQLKADLAREKEKTIQIIKIVFMLILKILKMAVYMDYMMNTSP
jgi:hypothetical protein